MITLRHHVLTIMAVFLALAVGVVLGSGPLTGVAERVSSPSGQQPTRGGEAGADFSQAFGAAVGPGLVAGKLSDRPVAVVSLPGADEQTTGALQALVEAAGGAVSSRVDLTDTMVDPGQKSLVDTLGSQLMTQQAKDVVSADATTYDRVGELLGYAVASRQGAGEQSGGAGTAVLEAMSGAGLLTVKAEPATRAPLVLLVLGRDQADDNVDAILTGLSEGLAAQALGVVVAGTLEDGGDGQLGRLRQQSALSTVATVDGVDLPAGRASAVLVLARSASTPGGAFGASGSDGPVPLR